jgi:predicted protein tyrosine phosphatase
MFALKVVGLDEANLLVCNNWPTHIISLMENRPTFDRDFGAHHLHIAVADVPFVTQHVISPRPEHLQAVLAFTKDLTETDRLLIHCFAGISRSTATAIGILIQHGLSYAEAFEKVAEVRRHLMPNELFIQHIDAHFDLDNKLVEYVKAHRQQTVGLPTGPTPSDINSMKAMLRLLERLQKSR